MPRAKGPNLMEVILNLTDILETGMVLANVIRALVKLFKNAQVTSKLLQSTIKKTRNLVVVYL